jgi:hypothetical protein
MLTIRPTKMLARRLGIKLPEAPPVVTNRVADWCAHEFRVSRNRYLIFFNTASLYPVLTHARGVTDDHKLIERLVDSLKLCLVGADLEFQFQRWIVPELAVVQWAPIPGRSIQGSMNDLILMAKYHLQYRDESPLELSYKLAKAPMSALGMNSPDRVFPTLGGLKT